MRVLNVYRTYFPDPPGGLQEAIRQICATTGKQSIENAVFTLSPKPVPSLILRPEAQVHRERSWAAPASCDIGSIAAFRRFRLLSRDCQALHYFFPWPFADLLHLGVRPGVPAMMTYISDIVRQKALFNLYAPLMQSMLSSMKIIVSNAPSYVDSSPVLSRPEFRKKVEIIPLGIDESTYPMGGDARILEKLGLTNGEPYFLFVGVLRYYKGLHYLLEAAGRIRSRIVIAGTGPEEAGLRHQIAASQLSNVILAGQISDEEKMTLLSGSTALVLPSHLRSEAYGMVLVEASMLGKPMISCEIGTGTSYVNLHGETGLVVHPASADALALAMENLASDPAMAQQMGQRARSRYERLFSGQALGRAYGALYSRLVE